MDNIDNIEDFEVQVEEQLIEEKTEKPSKVPKIQKTFVEDVNDDND